MRPQALERGRRITLLSDDALNARLSDTAGLDRVLEDLAADPGLADAEVDGVGDELDEERWDEAYEGRH